MNDDRFRYDQIEYQPVSVIFQYIEFFEKKEHQKINLLSTTAAIGWSAIINGFSKESKLEFSQLLPVQLQKEVPITKGFNTPTEQTISTIRRAYYTKRLPRKVLIDLAAIGLMKIIEQSVKK